MMNRPQGTLQAYRPPDEDHRKPVKLLLLLLC